MKTSAAARKPHNVPPVGGKLFSLVEIAKQVTTIFFAWSCINATLRDVSANRTDISSGPNATIRATEADLPDCLYPRDPVIFLYFRSRPDSNGYSRGESEMAHDLAKCLTVLRPASYYNYITEKTTSCTAPFTPGKEGVYDTSIDDACQNAAIVGTLLNTGYYAVRFSPKVRDNRSGRQQPLYVSVRCPTDDKATVRVTKGRCWSSLFQRSTTYDGTNTNLDCSYSARNVEFQINCPCVQNTDGECIGYNE